MPVEARKVEGDLLSTLREIADYARSAGAAVETDDNPFDRTLGFVVHKDGEGIKWAIPLTHLQRSLTQPLDMDEDTAIALRKLFMSAAGRGQLARMLSEGTFPGA